MTLKSKLKIENPITLLLSLFYIVVGIIFLSIFVVYNFLLNLGLIGVLSLITAYGMFRMKKWAVWLAVALFFIGITFGLFTLYDSIVLQTFQSAILFQVALIAYMILTLIVSIYVAANREKFE
jgi:uncharacterized membrane protein (DUF2068 family)